MKTTCLVNFLSLAFAMAFNFEFFDIPFSSDIAQNIYRNSLDILRSLLRLT